MINFITRHKYSFGLLLLSIVAFGGTLFYAPIYDYMDEFFPNRHFIINGLHNGILPLWLPYNCLGTPIFADPQSNFFYLPLWFLSLFGDYVPVMWGVGVIFNGFMAGAGFFTLTRRFVKNDLTAFVMGACYLMSGFFIGNMQHLPWIIGGVWLPWLLKNFIDLMQSPTPKTAILTAVFAALLFTGGYPGLPFILIYLLFIIMIYCIVVQLKNRNWKYFKRIAPLLLLCGGLCLILTLPELMGLWEVRHYITRGSALSYADASACTFTVQSLISLFYPLIACSEPNFTMTDISMGSIYVGLLTLFFAATGITKAKDGILKILLYWGLFCFLLSFGNLLPLHRWVFEWVPMMNFIRMPPLFRIFAIIALLLLAAKGLDEVTGNFSKYRKSLIVFIVSCMTACLIVAVICLVVKNPFTQKLLFCAVMQLLLFGLMWIGLSWRKGNWRLSLMIAVWLLEMAVNAALCLRHTGFDRNYTNRQFAALLARQPKNYPIPQRVTSAIEMAHESDWGHCWLNLGQLAKEVEFYGCNPMQLTSHRVLRAPYIENQKEILLPAVAFFPKSVIYTENPILFSLDTAYTHNPEEAAVYSNADSATLAISRFDPTRITMRTSATCARPLIICQNYYPGWKARTKEGELLKINVLNHSLMSINVPKGETHIELFFERQDIIIALWFSFAAWFGILLFFIIRSFLNRQEKSIKI
ncbi:MAG: YfhO family protein [Bacteroidales bacterium]|jgi:hypothetical protein|nr:YfhO family protein [Bacteroidales bacterium]